MLLLKLTWLSPTGFICLVVPLLNLHIPVFFVFLFPFPPNCSYMCFRPENLIVLQPLSVGTMCQKLILVIFCPAGFLYAPIYRYLEDHNSDPTSGSQVSVVCYFLCLTYSIKSSMSCTVFPSSSCRFSSAVLALVSVSSSNSPCCSTKVLPEFSSSYVSLFIAVF